MTLSHLAAALLMVTSWGEAPRARPEGATCGKPPTPKESVGSA